MNHDDPHNNNWRASKLFSGPDRAKQLEDALSNMTAWMNHLRKHGKCIACDVVATGIEEHLEEHA